jgi:peptidoglycan hydrolase CwlO-like protein
MKRLFPVMLAVAFIFFLAGCQVPGGSDVIQKITEGLEELEELDEELDELEVQIDELTETFNELSKAYDEHLQKYHKAKPVKIFIKKEITK